ncbi:hypothetical protein N665_1034s0008, partial [Sinapis alba]
MTSFCIMTLSKAFSLREAKGCCITFFTYMRVVRISGPHMLFKTLFEAQEDLKNLSPPHPLWNRNSSRILAFLCVGYVVKLERT